MHPAKLLFALTLLGSAALADTINVDVRSNFFRCVSSVPGQNTNINTIRVGDTVTWTWFGNLHSVTSDTALFDTGIHNIGFTFSFTFNNAGSFGYHCTVHGIPGAGMFGTIIVDNPPTDIQLVPDSVLEHSPNGTVVGDLLTTDADVGDSFLYALLDNAGGRFGLSGSQIVVADGSLLDFATATSHQIHVRTTDRGGNGYSFERDLTIHVTAATPPCPGDVNGDGMVDLADLAVLLAHFGMDSGATLLNGDLDGNGSVDLADLALLLAQFGNVC